jgi:alpha-L-fucosidase
MLEAPAYLDKHAAQWPTDPRGANLAWFREAKFGLFVHYGLYSLLEAGEWVQFRQKIPLADYGKLAERFTAEKFDADQITDLACEARMKYVNLVTCHHDSFCLWDSTIESFNSMRSAAKRDLVAEMAEQCRKKKLGFFTYYTYALNWRHPYYVDNGRLGFARPAYDVRPSEYRYREPADFAKYVDYVHAAITELLTNYGPLAGVWFDIISAAHAMPELIPTGKTYELVRRLQPGTLIAYKQGATGDEDFASCEFQAGSLEHMMREKYGEAAAQMAKHAWESNSRKHNEVCATLATSWGWKAGDRQKSADEVRTMLANAAGKNCNLLLNIGPHPDGSIPDEAVKTLRDVGRQIDREGFPVPSAEAGGPAGLTTLPQ